MARVLDQGVAVGHSGDEIGDPSDAAGLGDPPPVDQGLDERDKVLPPTASGGRIKNVDGRGPAVLLQRFGIPLGVATLALAAAYFAFRS